MAFDEPTLSVALGIGNVIAQYARSRGVVPPVPLELLLGLLDRLEGDDTADALG